MEIIAQIRGIMTKRVVPLMILVIITFSSGCFSSSQLTTPPSGVTLLLQPESHNSTYLNWSADGEKIAITSISSINNASRIDIYDIVSGKIRTVKQTKWGAVVAGGWSPDNRKIAYSMVGSADESRNGIWLANVDGTEPEQFIGGGYSVDWSPDGTSLAIASLPRVITGNVWEVSILIYDLRENKSRIIFTDSGPFYKIYRVMWSPNGTELAFSYQYESEINELSYDIAVLDINAKRVDQVTYNRSSHDPSWSPDGKMIAYIKHQPDDSLSSLNIIYINGSCDTTVLQMEGGASPAWSPEGQIAVIFSDGGIYSIDLPYSLGIDILKTGLNCP